MFCYQIRVHFENDARMLFRQGSFDFFGIPKVIEQTMAAHQKDFTDTPTLDEIVATDTWAREQVEREAERLAKGAVLL